MASVAADSVDHAVRFRAEQDGCASLELGSPTGIHAQWQRDMVVLTEGNAQLLLTVNDDGTNLSCILQVRDIRDYSVKGRLMLGQGNTIASLREGDLYYDYAQHRWETHNGTAAYYLNMTAA